MVNPTDAFAALIGRMTSAVVRLVQLEFPEARIAKSLRRVAATLR